jgi:nitrate reductase gamma subunit
MHSKPGRRKKSRFFSDTAILIAFLTIAIFHGSAIEASWLIDRVRYHISVHSRSSCLDCHGDIPGRKNHPDPLDVNRDIRDFFRLRQCIGCHRSVMHKLDRGTHGRERIANREDYMSCIDCHDPHYQLTRNSPLGTYPAMPRSKLCAECHEYRTALPEVSAEDKGCVNCHESIKTGAPGESERISRFCFNCHKLTLNGDRSDISASIPRIDISEYRESPHVNGSCLGCHPRSTEFRHSKQVRASCRRCHDPHDAKTSNDAHLTVACEACHLPGAIPFRDAASRLILRKPELKRNSVSSVHNFVLTREEGFCRKCHFSENSLGAASMVLPAKSVICMPCHSATFSAGDTITILSLLAFLFGIISIASVLMSGKISGAEGKSIAFKIIILIRIVSGAIFSKRIFSIIKSLILDSLLQRRLYRQSRTRWFIHSMIFYPFLLRFSWGLIALILSICATKWPLTWAMLDRNHSLNAFLFDLTGIMVLAGIAIASLRRIFRRSEKITGLPRQDWLSFMLIGGIIVIGFILEGVRIAMAGSPDGGYALVGFSISLLVKELSGLPDAYGYIWYIHAILTGIFVAYLPFSRMFHIIVAPVVMAINAVAEGNND